MATTSRAKVEKQEAVTAQESVVTVSNTTTSTPRHAHGRVDIGEGSVAEDKSTRVDIGFRPSHVRWVNAADRVECEWLSGMDPNTCLKVGADGVRTLETENGGISIDDRGFSIAHGEKLGAVLPAKACFYEARG